MLIPASTITSEQAPFGADGGVQGVEVNDECVGLDHVHGAQCRLDALIAAQLRGTEVGEQRNVRTMATQFAGQAMVHAGFQRNALRTDAQGDAQRLRRFHQVDVDARSTQRAAGHRAHQQRRAQAPANEPGAQVDGIQGQLGQCAMLEAVVLEPGGGGGGRPRRVQHHVQVIILAPDHLHYVLQRARFPHARSQRAHFPPNRCST